MSPLPPPGWYCDPSSSRIYRWWDGSAWTKHTSVGQPAAGVVPVADPVAVAPAPVSASPSFGAANIPAAVSEEVRVEAGTIASGTPGRTSIGQSLWRRNQFTLITLGIVAIYLVLAVESGIVMLGVWPILTSVRSWQRKEPAAGLAVCASVVAVLFAIVALTGN